MGISLLQVMALYGGGEDGTSIQDASDAFTGECHIIKVKTDATTFSVLGAKTQADATLNMLTGANNLATKEFAKGDLVTSPFGGYISAFTASEDVEYYKLPDTNTNRQTP